MSKIKELIENTIETMVADSNTVTPYRTPLVGYANASDLRFETLKQVAHARHFLPTDLLPNAKTVIAFFVPFTRELVETNRNHIEVSREWAVAYVETNRLINDICLIVKDELEKMGVGCGTVPATGITDKALLMSYWSHRHVAHIAGLGTFGINNMLITKLGCAGRYGSFVIDKCLEPTESPTTEYCLYKRDGSCGACVALCPTGALEHGSFDRHKCYAFLREVADQYKSIGKCDVCGKCCNAVCAVFE